MNVVDDSGADYSSGVPVLLSLQQRLHLGKK
jgi:hypothetical protein